MQPQTRSAAGCLLCVTWRLITNQWRKPLKENRPEHPWCMVYTIWMWEGVCQTGVWKPNARSTQGTFAWARRRIHLQQNVSWVPDSMKFSNIYRVAKVERCVDCLVKKVIESQLCPMNFSRDGRYMLSRTRQLLLQQVWNTFSENWDQTCNISPLSHG